MRILVAQMGTAQLHKRRSDSRCLCKRLAALDSMADKVNNLAVTGKERFFLFWIGIEVKVLSVIVKVTTSRACVSPKIKWIIATAIIRIISKSHAYLHSMQKTSEKFQNNRRKTVRGVTPTRYPEYFHPKGQLNLEIP